MGGRKDPGVRAEAVAGPYLGDACLLYSHCSHRPSRTEPRRVLVDRGRVHDDHLVQHLPGLGIGLVSYDSMAVTIGGAYASDVVQVVHAGYDPGTTVSGVPAADFADFHLLSATPDGGPLDVIVDDIPPVVGDGGNSFIPQYFETTMGGGTLVFHQCQYDAYSGTLKVSQGGTCN